MKYQYKLIVNNNKIYREFEISPEYDVIHLGTTSECELRLNKDDFFRDIFLELSYQNGIWEMSSSEGVYINRGDMRKLMATELRHGDVVSLKYVDTDDVIFKVRFFIDFEAQVPEYNSKVYLPDKKEWVIGTARNADIMIESAFSKKDELRIAFNNGSYVLREVNTEYGVALNGVRLKGEHVLNDHDFFSVSECFFYYKNSELFFDSSHVRSGKATSVILKTNSFIYPKFIRNTRVQYQVNEDEIEIQQPAAKPHDQKKSILLTLIPALVMLAMTIVLRGILGSGGTFVIYSAVSISMGAIVSVITYKQDKKQVKEDTENREKAYLAYTDEKEKLIMSMRQRELESLRKIYVSLDDDIREIYSFGGNLFEKTEGDQDFLRVYLGTGTVESLNQVKFNKVEFVDPEDPITLLPEKISEKFRYISDAPIVANLYESNGVGFVGSIDSLRALLKNVTIDICARHFFKDVKLAYLLDEEFQEDTEWLRWLRNLEADGEDIRCIAYDTEGRNMLLEYLYAVLSFRESLSEEDREHKYDEWYVVFISDCESTGRHPVSKYFRDASKYGFTFVYLERYEERIPAGCGELIRLDDTTRGHLVRTENGDELVGFTFNEVPEVVAAEATRRLGAVQIDEVSLEGQLTKSITMFELLNIFAVEDLDLETRWSESQVYKSLSAPIGVKANADIVSLNISDGAKGHGPHGLVAGTTGSGKSEILQTYILSMATLFHPYDVGFVVIDFKGGGMANQFEKLPHLIGTITNIDGREIDRSLLSIKAELIKRQEMFSQAGVNHINDYIRLYKAGTVSEPMPHLIMIVDEFAELKAEYPDFMKELISAARIGRTLGVHLILATQKPAGVVDAQIWSNSKFKLCLKVQTKEDSNEVLKTPLAAEIVEPGRAYLQVGNNEIFELIQSAYSGAGVPVGSSDDEKTFAVYERNIWGKKTLIYTNKRKDEDESQLTQLDAIVEHVNTYCEARGIEKLPGICLPALPQVIGTGMLDYDASGRGFTVPIGVFDDPANQRQAVIELDPSRENVYIVGSSQSGKTVLLQTIMYGLMRKYTPDQVSLYIVDCGSMVLRLFEESKHVGGVVTSNEEEKCKNLFKLLSKTVSERKNIISGAGVGNYASYLETGKTDMPLMVVIIDNYAAFKEFFPDQSEMLGSLTREAQGVGISFIVTAPASNSMNYRIQANFAQKLALNCNDDGEYSNIFGHCREIPREYAGSGLVSIEKRILNWQAAIFGEGDTEAARSSELKAYIEQRNDSVSTSAHKIPMVPDKIVLSELMAAEPKMFREAGLIPFGMSFSSIEYVFANIYEWSSLSLLGDNERRLTFIKAFLTILQKTIVFHNVEAIVIDDKAGSLKDVCGGGFISNYTTGAADGLSALTEFIEESENRVDAPEDTSTLVLVMNNQDVLRQACADKDISKDFALAMKRSRENKSFMLVSQIENIAVGFNISDIYKSVKEEAKGILFAQMTDNKLYEINGRIRPDSTYDDTMGYFVSDGEYTRIRIFD